MSLHDKHSRINAEWGGLWHTRTKTNCTELNCTVEVTQFFEVSNTISCTHSFQSHLFDFIASLYLDKPKFHTSQWGSTKLMRWKYGAEVHMNAFLIDLCLHWCVNLIWSSQIYEVQWWRQYSDPLVKWKQQYHNLKILCHNLKSCIQNDLSKKKNHQQNAPKATWCICFTSK